MVNPGVAAAWKLSQTEHTRETGNHTLDSNSLHLVTNLGYGKKREAQPILSGNGKITTAKKGFMHPEKELLGWIILDWDRKD